MNAVELGLVELNHAWRVGFAPAGVGICLYVDRGIACAGNTQVFSLHMTDTPTREALQKAVEAVKPHVNKVIDAAVALIRALRLPKPISAFDGHDPNGNSDVTREAIAMLVYRQILVEIARELVESEK